MCKYCYPEDEWSEVPKEWVFSERLNVVITEIGFGAYVYAPEKCMTVWIDNGIGKKVLCKEVPIKFCPMCGREL